MRPLLLSVAICATQLPFLALNPAHAGQRARVEIFDRTAGYALPVYSHQDRLYVAGEPGHQYELRIANRSGERLLAVTSVDGVNVITGKTADQQQSGYVLDPWNDVEVEGWRKSLGEVATFYFTRLADSYAARTGRPENIGVIGVALFREQRRCCHPHPYEDRAASGNGPAPAAKEESQLGTGHGHREDSPAQYVDFQRASNTPEETIVIYYDSRQNLLARGVILESRRYADQLPNPFPDGMFVPDP